MNVWRWGSNRRLVEQQQQESFDELKIPSAANSRLASPKEGKPSWPDLVNHGLRMVHGWFVNANIKRKFFKIQLENSLDTSCPQLFCFAFTILWNENPLPTSPQDSPHSSCFIQFKGIFLTFYIISWMNINCEIFTNKILPSSIKIFPSIRNSKLNLICIV